ncbi:MULTISPECIES: glutamine--tRNA ligase/YqeY domain fusion protein [unclassified Oceanispirochaeta]|uniref:glutamine--tRNA ligase/YqeY domain fusion protein n=1 Tax=unclassified Oceanispirochaeta TaxID=2635722 RepID=UPI000E092E9B|nr:MULTISPECIES: glutamine--tRNA ligase/YqeY domain fusion protein [unclassified Oceanispirochaeta]MBF9015623.1 glutamine--tRNA ligase/YqeY domain fusion protein [Oceanispirochaeta sp. M2]NPD73397.1 glutamine--tRNA ligase/YqeY domain fusion protein [Oceanispirochaeta sp. M1]RDG30871.1 glutamine--tRNA ligase/YqeY domain fusion protein [Oceanispirochaeta sp. M1]
MAPNINEKENDGKTKGPDFIRQFIKEDLASGKNSEVHTRFPPEPNGYLHIGHGKSICLNFGIAEDFNGKCNLRFDDTNPSKEDQEYVDSIIEDVNWLGFNPDVFYASDYFDQMYAWALELIDSGKAYVDSQNAEEMRANRGTPTKAGVDSPFRNRSLEENRALFEKMTKGELDEGSCILRAKIDMAHQNMNMRDPAIYRIRKESHHRSGDKWKIYPMYDFAHGYEDAIEGISHSICTLEFENHRPLYDWFLDNVSAPCHPRQIEFARLNLSYTIMSKRKLLELVTENMVNGWDDPRMPTLSGFRRRGYTPASIRRFAKEIGVSKVNSLVDINFLQYIIREELNASAERAMAVINPLKVTITNYPEGQIEDIVADNNPGNPEAGTRMVPFGREIYIEKDDFMEDAPKKFFRLAPGREVRLKHAYFITCTEVIKDDSGEVVELLCSYDPATKGGDSPDGRKVKGTLHWVSVEKGIKGEVRLYDNLFTLENMDDMEEGKNYKDYINSESLVVKTDCILEPSLADAPAAKGFQFMRQGYFCADSRDHSPEHPVYNRTVALKDSWAKLQKKG